MYIYPVFSAEKKRKNIHGIFNNNGRDFIGGFNMPFDIQGDGADRGYTDIFGLHTALRNKHEEG